MIEPKQQNQLDSYDQSEQTTGMDPLRSVLNLCGHLSITALDIQMQREIEAVPGTGCLHRFYVLQKGRFSALPGEEERKNHNSSGQTPKRNILHCLQKGLRGLSWDEDQGFFCHVLHNHGTVERILYLEMEQEEHVDFVRNLFAAYEKNWNMLRLALLDPLTGLKNRTELSSLQQQLIKKVGPGGENAAFFVVIDLDHFKSINDTYGHLMGDEVLVFVSNVIKEIFYTPSVCIRYGGEEFGIIFQGDRQDLLDRLTLCRKILSRRTFAGNLTVNFSAGLTTFRGSDYPFSIVDRADRALYFAKEHGRGRTEIFETLCELGHLSEAEPEAGSAVIWKTKKTEPSEAEEPVLLQELD